MSVNIEYQKKLWKVLKELQETIIGLSREQYRLDFQSRSNLYTNTIPGFDEKLFPKTNHLKTVDEELNVTKWIHYLMSQELNMDRHFKNPQNFISELQNLIIYSEEKRFYKKAAMLKHWRAKMI